MFDEMKSVMKFSRADVKEVSWNLLEAFTNLHMKVNSSLMYNIVDVSYNGEPPNAIFKYIT